MLIEITKHRKKPVPAVLCIAALGDEPRPDGKIWAEFYPVDLLLQLRNADWELKGHPYYDLVPICEKDGQPGRMIEYLTRSQAKRIKKELDLDKMVAIGLTLGRPKRDGQRPQRPQFFYVGMDETGLTPEDNAWLDAICESGTLLQEQCQGAIKAIADFCQALYQVVASQPKKRKAKLKRKERRRIEAR